MVVNTTDLAGISAVVEHTIDAADHPFEGGPIELIGPAETVPTRASRRLASGFQMLSARP